MTALATGVSAGWLALREPADAAARAGDLVAAVRAQLPTGRPTVVHDLGCGSGSMGRWLAPRLPGPQHWVAYDRDADLLAHAARDAPRTASDGSPVTLRTRQHDVTRLTRDDLAGASLITASALLDILTADELERLVTACADAGCPALLTLSVVGRVQLTPADALDADVAAAFNAHQRRSVLGRRLLGPDAPAAAADAFARRGAEVQVSDSPWHLGPADAPLATEWLTGWIGAAFEQQPALATVAADYARDRLEQAAAGELRVTVHHLDLLAGPPRRGSH